MYFLFLHIFHLYRSANVGNGYEEFSNVCVCVCGILSTLANKVNICGLGRRKIDIYDIICETEGADRNNAQNISSHSFQEFRNFHSFAYEHIRQPNFAKR